MPEQEQVAQQKKWRLEKKKAQRWNRQPD